MSTKTPPTATTIRDPALVKTTPLRGVTIGFDLQGHLRVVREDLDLPHEARRELARGLAELTRQLLAEVETRH